MDEAMGYCSWCQRLDGAKCAHCGSKTRAPKDDDPVLLAVLDGLHADMIAPLLDENGILNYCQSDMNTLMGTSLGGMLLSSVRIYVPYAAFRRARTLIEGFFADDPAVMNNIEAGESE